MNKWQNSSINSYLHKATLNIKRTLWKTSLCPTAEDNSKQETASGSKRKSQHSSSSYQTFKSVLKIAHHESYVHADILTFFLFLSS